MMVIGVGATLRSVRASTTSTGRGAEEVLLVGAAIKNAPTPIVTAAQLNKTNSTTAPTIHHTALEGRFGSTTMIFLVLRNSIPTYFQQHPMLDAPGSINRESMPCLWLWQMPRRGILQIR